MTTNVGRAIYIVYSLFTIPIMTILISLLSDSFFSKFQKAAENIGVKSVEDQHHLPARDLHPQVGPPKWKICFRKVFHRRPRESYPPTPQAEPERDVERNEIPVVNDDFLREEVLAEVESIKESVDKEVDKELGINEPKSRSMDRAREKEVRRRKKAKTEEGDGSIQEDVERAIEEEREE